MSAKITLLIPNRDDASKPPTIEMLANVESVPQEGETVILEGEGDEETTWVVKWVEHTIYGGRRSTAGAQRIRVRLIEPGHWSRAT